MGAVAVCVETDAQWQALVELIDDATPARRDSRVDERLDARALRRRDERMVRARAQPTMQCRRCSPPAFRPRPLSVPDTVTAIRSTTRAASSKQSTMPVDGHTSHRRISRSCSVASHPLASRDRRPDSANTTARSWAELLGVDDTELARLAAAQDHRHPPRRLTTDPPRARCRCSVRIETCRTPRTGRRGGDRLSGWSSTPLRCETCSSCSSISAMCAVSPRSSRSPISIPTASRDVLHEAGRFVGDVIAPTNRDGDKVGSRRNDDGTRHHAAGLQAGVPTLGRRWVGGRAVRSDLRRRRIAVGGRDRGERDGHCGEHGVFVVPDVDAGRDPHARRARQRRAEGHVPAPSDLGRVERARCC